MYNLVPGGKGRKRKSSDFDPKELAIGRKIEREHFVGSGLSEEEIDKRALEIAMDHLTEDPHYYTKKNHDFKAELKKEGGGPGSGVTGDNTLPIGLPLSQYVSVGSRKSILDNMPFYEDTVPMSKITAVAQKNYVPTKLNRMVDQDGILSKPIDLLKVSEDEYHVIDGHHRYLVARTKDKKSIRARVYTRRKES